MVTVGLDPPRMRNKIRHLESVRPNTKIKVIVGVEQTTENTEGTYYPIKRDLKTNVISRK